MSKRFQQSDFWCDFKANHGWKYVKHNDINILYRTFKKAFFNFSLAYVPMALEFNPKISVPGFSEQAMQEVDYLKQIVAVSNEIKSSLPKNTMFIRYDFPLDFPTVEIRDDYLSRFDELCSFAKVKIKKSSVDIQPPDSTFLDLSLSEDDLLKNMKNKWRYNLRYAQKHGVVVRKADPSSSNFESDLNSFYELYKETASRDGISIHSKSYYEDLLRRCENSTDTKINLYIASHEGEDLSAIITLFQQDEAIYLYGCSGNKKRNLMPNYLVQWTAIQEAKQFGSKIYDFYGIPPTADEKHPMHGLYLFKMGFGGREVHRPGSFDIPLKKSYKLYRILENLRAFYHKKVKKIIRGR